MNRTSDGGWWKVVQSKKHKHFDKKIKNIFGEELTHNNIELLQDKYLPEK